MAGRYFQGDRVPLRVLCTDAAGVPTVPDRSPVAAVYNGGSLVASLRIPLADKYGSPALFAFPLQLDSRFLPGPLQVVYQYTVSGQAMSTQETATILPGGNADGASVGLVYFRTPAADEVLVQTDLGRVVRRRNPRLP